MDYSIGKEQEMLRKSAREFFEKECPKEKVRELKTDPRAYDPKMWKKMVKLGFQGLAIPEEFGGMDGDFVELALFMEEVGRNIVPMPYYSTVALCALPLMAYGSDKQKEAFLPGIAEKGDIWTLAQTEDKGNNEASEIQLTAEEKDDTYLLNGTKIFVPYAHVATRMLVAARTSNEDDPQTGVTLFIVDPKHDGIRIEGIPTVARDGRCGVVFENVQVAKADILGPVDEGWDILDDIQQQGALLKAAEMSGGAQAAFEIVLAYAKERKQFDKPIGQYQAVQFRLVDMRTDLDSLKYMVRKAAWHIAAGKPSRLLNSAAKAKANEVYDNVGHYGIYLHGAIGWTEEMDIGLYHLRTRSMIYDCGGTDLHLEIIARELEEKVPDFIELWGSAS
ncbi:acyl-CoA/acyl-ACP dehydrogenase [bacterium]|nr:acyl-CoA/acyl-ACP dehydrogenase [bacterium]